MGRGDAVTAAGHLNLWRTSAKVSRCSSAARLDPTTTWSCTGRPGADGHHPVIVADLREDRPTQAATVVLPIRVGGVVVTDPDGVSWSCSNCATIFTRTP